MSTFVRLVVLTCIAACALPVAARAQEALAVTVSPPLIQLTIGPGETWSSALKVTNTNKRDVTYYATVLDFEATGEEGVGTFIPRVQLGAPTGPTGYSLASWIVMASTSVTIPAGESGSVPFTVQVPQNAEPGGHYAAILVGTQPGTGEITGPTMQISSYVSSLIFVRLRGEAIESGRIREFRTEQSVYDTADANFLLRFENTGNTHLKPQGDIVIYNMWGKKRGELAVNQERHFGNVLPQSTRRFTFAWAGEGSLADIGRYSAVVTLAFGDGDKRNLSAITYFWVVPTVPLATALAVIAGFVLIIVWFIRRYVRRALSLERERLGTMHAPTTQPTASLAVLMEPLREGVVDLRRATGTQMQQGEITATQPRPAYAPLSFIGFLLKYKLFFVFIALMLVALWGSVVYVRSALVSSRTFQISDVRIEEERIENNNL
ncbi:MAG: hypothetical protein RLZZ342_334 [Candidatus Parcubacteria bacterium]|jgi:hypothetical protein